jgi:hypothetical protein
MRETILIIMGILFTICYIKVGTEVAKTKPFYVLLVAAMLSMFAFELAITLTLISQNDALKSKVKNKCPEYEEVHGLYRLKKK